MPSSSSDLGHPSGEANTFALTPATPACPHWRSSRNGYIPHVKGRGQEAGELKRDPRKKARRWVVEVAPSWFNRFRKLLVRYEKLERSFLALNHLPASIMAFRKIRMEVNIIYG